MRIIARRRSLCGLSWLYGTNSGTSLFGGRSHVLHDFRERRPRLKHSVDPTIVQGCDVVIRNDAAPKEDDIAGTAGAKQLGDAWKEIAVRAGQQRNPDGVDVLLHRGFNDGLGRLMNAEINDLHPSVAERPRDDLRSAVVPVETCFRDEYPIGMRHRCIIVRP